MEVSASALLLYGGLSVMALTVVAGILSAVVLHVTKKKLNARLDAEYGKRRH